MDDVLTGVLALVVGLALCFRGYLAIRILLPIWGAFVGFGVGVGLVAAVGGDGVLTTVLSWIVGAVVAVVFALLAYLYYEVCVVIALGAIGFVLGSTLLMALGIDWNWLVTLGGLCVGLAFAALAIFADLPMVVLTVVTALAGSATAVTGVMLLVGAIDVEEFDGSQIVAGYDDAGAWWWWVYVVLGVVGVVAQIRLLDSLTRSVRDEWTAAGGHGLYDPRGT